MNFLLALLEGIEVDGLFPSIVGMSDEGFGSVAIVSVLVQDLAGDFVGDLVGVFIRGFVGDFDGDFGGDLVKDFSGSISVGGVGSFVRDGGGV